MRVVAAVVAASVVLGAQQSQRATGTCVQLGRPLFLPAVPEASGIAFAGGALWTLNDSAVAEVFRLDASGRSTALAVIGAGVRDWEDLASGACSAGTCLYVADIGDNRGSRERITVYEVPLPPLGSASTKPLLAHHVRYPDHPHDAEALLMTKKLGMFIITKEVPPRVYQSTPSTKPGETGTLRLFRTLKETVHITGGAVSPDERWVALRSNGTLLLYGFDDFAKGAEPVRINLADLKEPQGEGVTFGSNGELYLVSEGGGKNAAGMLTRVRCAFIR